MKKFQAFLILSPSSLPTEEGKNVVMMFVLLTIAIAGILWLSHRFKILLQLPIETSINNLAIAIPTVPLLSVNKITDTTVLVHWDNYLETPPAEKKESSAELPVLPQVQSHSISHFVLYINGLQSNVINGRQQSITLQNLTPGTNYQIDLVAFNVAGYRSRSSSVFIKTAANEFKSQVVRDEGMDYPDSIVKNLLNEEERKSIVKVDIFKSASPLSRSRSDTVGDSPDRKGLSNDVKANNNLLVPYNNNLPHLTTDINELKWMLESALSEYNSLLKADNDASAEFNEEESNLLATRNEAKERRKYEDASRASLRQEIKLLEEQKLKNKNRFVKDEKKLVEKKLKIYKQKEEIVRWKTQINEMKEKQAEFKLQKPLLIEQYKRQIDDLNNEIFTVVNELQDMNEDLKSEINTRKHLETNKKKLGSLASQLPLCLNTNTGLYNAEGIEIIEAIAKIVPECAEELRDELIIKDQDIFNSWKKNEDELIRKINGMHINQSEYASIPNLFNPNAAITNNGSTNHLTSKAPPSSSASLTSKGMNNSSSLLGFNVSPELQFSQLDTSHRRIPSNNSWNNDVWSGGNNNSNSNNNNISSLNAITDEQHNVNLLLPQNLMNEGIDIFPANSLPSQNSMNPVSPNISHINGFDYNLNGTSSNGFINTPQQPTRITSLSALTNSAKNLMHKKNGSAPKIDLLRSPSSSVPVQLTNEAYVPTIFLEGTSQSSPFNPQNVTTSTTTNAHSGAPDSQWGLLNGSFSYVDSNLASSFPNEGGRARSGSNRTIWSNNNSIITGNGGGNSIHNFLSAPINISSGGDNYLYSSTPPDAHAGVMNIEIDNNDLDEHTSSSFSLKNRLFKFGLSPNKTISNKTHEDEEEIDEIHTHKHNKSNSSTISQTSSGFLTHGLTTTSRFFKKHRLSTGTFPVVNETPLDETDEPQHSNEGKPEPSGGLRRLSLFGKTDKRQ